MGLSASQARLLSLTARQSNLEYEGQQINQQRTTLSNESSNYYNSLLEMSVPVPPSTNDYTKIVYTFVIGGNTATVKQALPQNDSVGNTTYVLTYTTNLSTIGIQENAAYKTAATAKRQTTGSVTPTAAGAEYDENKKYLLATMNRLSDADLEKEEFQNITKYVAVSYTDLTSGATVSGEGTEGGEGGEVGETTAETTSKPIIYIGPDGYQISKETFDEKFKNTELAKECKFYREYIDSQTDGTKTKYAISYAQIPNQTTYEAHNDSTGSNYADMIYEYNEDGEDGGYFFYQASNKNAFTVVDPKYAEAFESADLDINDYYQYESTSGIRFVQRNDVEGNLNNETRSIPTSAVATITKVQENTMAGAVIEFDAQGRISTVTDEEGITYTMTATTETDNAAYDDAYNQYEYNQYVYDQRQNEINANIKILQAQDKSLELRLSTLDTQHSAIQTELEAVKKVMSKNIDNSFKTFNA